MLILEEQIPVVDIITALMVHTIIIIQEALVLAHLLALTQEIVHAPIILRQMEVDVVLEALGVGLVVLRLYVMLVIHLLVSAILTFLRMHMLVVILGTATVAIADLEINV